MGRVQALFTRQGWIVNRLPGFWFSDAGVAGTFDCVVVNTQKGNTQERQSEAGGLISVPTDRPAPLYIALYFLCCMDSFAHSIPSVCAMVL